MTTATDDLTLTVTHTYAAAPDRVFDAWLDPAVLPRFMTPAADMSVTACTADAVEGGRFEIVMHKDGEDMPHAGTYLTIDRPNRLVFTWESRHSVAEGSTVTLDFVPRDGGTELTLTHVRFATESSRDGHEAGWTAILAELERVL
ncbi:SRPBCC domain-containing protein [Rhodobacterales bacterium HKCCE2091]|nr:SRPBCC domain-containing protein [Rhodobacterales bacterium HKCCE2091]